MTMMEIIIFCALCVVICLLGGGLGYQLRGVTVDEEIKKLMLARNRAGDAIEDASRIVKQVSADAEELRKDLYGAYREIDQLREELAEAKKQAGADRRVVWEEPETEEQQAARQRAKEEQEAFRLLRSYSPATAYGMEQPLPAAGEVRSNGG